MRCQVGDRFLHKTCPDRIYECYKSIPYPSPYPSPSGNMDKVDIIYIRSFRWVDGPDKGTELDDFVSISYANHFSRNLTEENELANLTFIKSL